MTSDRRDGPPTSAGLGVHVVAPAVAVTNLARSRQFYEKQLGLTDVVEEPGGLRYSCGRGSTLFVYESPHTAGRAEHTVAGWYVDDLPALMKELVDRGVTFEQYEEGTPTDDEGTFSTADFRAAWVCDPDGNTFAIQEYFHDEEPTIETATPAPVVHVEVRGTDPDRLRSFYSALAGWQLDLEAEGARVAQQVSEPGRYGFADRVPGLDGSGVPSGVGGGIDHQPYAIFYLGVPNVDTAVRRAEGLGGSRVMGPVQADDRDLVIAHVRDPEGNLFGLAGPVQP